MRDGQVRKGRLLAVGMAICAVACGGWAAPVLASPPTVTIEGSGADGYTPSSSNDHASVKATLSAGVATGTIETTGINEGIGHKFKGVVTCMVIEAAHTTIGALGTGQLVPNFGPPKAVPGEFAQLLTITFGKFTDVNQEESPIYAASFGGMFGNHDEGVESSVAPACSGAGAPSVSYLPTFGGEFHVSPSINSPKDGTISETGTVTLSGTAEPNTTIWVYEEGEEPAEGTAVTVNAEGAWSLTVEGLSAGVHVFSARAQSGSKVPSNTVEVEVGSPSGGHHHHHHHHHHEHHHHEHHHHHKHGGELTDYGTPLATLPAHPGHR